jgi:hypothetical protein
MLVLIIENDRLNKNSPVCQIGQVKLEHLKTIDISIFGFFVLRGFSKDIQELN